MLLSALLAPIRMLFHTQFVAMALAGHAVRWKSPPRGDSETGWRYALRRHGLHTLVGVLWAAIVWWLNPSYLWWLLPVVGALILSIPLSVFTSRVGLGRKLRRRLHSRWRRGRIRGCASLSTRAGARRRKAEHRLARLEQIDHRIEVRARLPQHRNAENDHDG
jgi:hypothetical protein